MTPIWPLLPVQTGSKSLLLKQIISQQPQEVNSQFYTIVQIVNCQKNIDQKVTPIWPLLPVQTGSQSLLLKQIISQQPQEVNLQFVHYCTDRLFSKFLLQKVTPIWPLLPVQTGSQKFTIKTNHISTTARGKFTIFTPLYRSLIVKKIFTKKWPQFDLYFLSKPEVKVEYL